MNPSTRNKLILLGCGVPIACLAFLVAVLMAMIVLNPSSFREGLHQGMKDGYQEGLKHSDNGPSPKPFHDP